MRGQTFGFRGDPFCTSTTRTHWGRELSSRVTRPSYSRLHMLWSPLLPGQPQPLGPSNGRPSGSRRRPRRAHPRHRHHLLPHLFRLLSPLTMAPQPSMPHHCRLTAIRFRDVVLPRADMSAGRVARFGGCPTFELIIPPHPHSPISPSHGEASPYLFIMPHTYVCRSSSSPGHKAGGTSRPNSRPPADGASGAFSITTGLSDLSDATSFSRAGEDDGRPILRRHRKVRSAGKMQKARLKGRHGLPHEKVRGGKMEGAARGFCPFDPSQAPPLRAPSQPRLGPLLLSLSHPSPSGPSSAGCFDARVASPSADAGHASQSGLELTQRSQRSGRPFATDERTRTRNLERQGT